LQVPEHDPRAVQALIDFTHDLEPDTILCVGDELDSPEPSHWNKGYAGEYSGTLQRSIDETNRILFEFRNAAPDADFHLMRSNHGERIQKYIRRYAPALEALRSLDYATLLGLAPLGIEYHKQPYAFAPGWIMAHGDEGSMIKTPGGTAMGLARRWGRSVVCGHTHKAGVQHDHDVLNGKTLRRLHGMEVGHLMDIRKAGYLDAGSANWQQAFGVFHVSGTKTHHQLIEMHGRSFLYDEEVRAW
jgi:hypothetical protein